VWSAILASTLTHIAVFLPLLFLSGTASIMFTQLSVVVMFSLIMSLFVAVTIVPVLCSRWLKTPDEEAAATWHHGQVLPPQLSVSSKRWTKATGQPSTSPCSIVRR
jgi:multidrug efflux pump subunit AcrB